MKGSHTGESMLENWKISEDRVHLVVADNASNMQRAVKEDQFEAGLLCTHITISGK